jgi:hypothetical protein
MSGKTWQTAACWLATGSSHLLMFTATLMLAQSSPQLYLLWLKDYINCFGLKGHHQVIINKQLKVKM